MISVPGVLELGGGLLLDAENDGVGAADADGGVTLTDGLERVLDLEKMTVWREHGNGSVVPRHLSTAAAASSFVFLLLIGAFSCELRSFALGSFSFQVTN